MSARTLARSLLVWLLLMAAETLHGLVRVLLLQPIVGDFRARQIAVFTGCLILGGIVLATGRWVSASSVAQLWSIGLGWAALTLSFEVALGRSLGLSWERIPADYNLARGGLMPLGLAFMASAPVLCDKMRERRKRQRSP